MNEKNRLLCEIVKEKADALLIFSPVNRRYVTGFKSSAGTVVVKGDSITYFTDFRYFESACIARENGFMDNDIDVRLLDGMYMKTLKEMLCDCKSVLFEDGYLAFGTYNWYKNSLSPTELVGGGSEILANLRSIKTEKELDNIVKAQSITDKAFDFAVKLISDNVGKKDFTERALQIEMDYFMLRSGADGLAFDTIAINGAKTSLPHGVPEDKTIENGFITMDFGASFNGYCSDMTRTVSVGEPSEEMKKVYETVLLAQNAAFEVIRADIAGKVADEVARNVIDNAGYKGTFGHSLGHSLGLEIHEGPCFASGVETLIPENAVISVEPGIYLEGKFGVRIEDIVCVKRTGFVNLTHSPKNLLVI